MPKEYIEREALFMDLSETLIFSGRPGEASAEVRGANKVISRIKNAPTADVVEVKHGEWIEGQHVWECSICGKWNDVLQGTAEMNYCPNCGAKMTEAKMENRIVWTFKEKKTGMTYIYNFAESHKEGLKRIRVERPEFELVNEEIISDKKKLKAYYTKFTLE